jgi:Tol biopolymer transport system component/DNA-binding winged helix-turn-helix (wHTH) protein
MFRLAALQRSAAPIMLSCSGMIMKSTERRVPFALKGWIVDPELHLLSCGDVVHTIEPRVMSVLLELADRPHHVVSKAEFFEKVWPDTFVGEDALTRCISVLRHLLGDDPHHPRFIKTVAKAGYCLLVAARPVEDLSEPLAQVSPALATAPVRLDLPAQRPVPTASSDPPVKIFRAGAILRIAALGPLSLAAVIAVLILRDKQSQPTSVSAISTFEVTMDAGEESRPALSPNGKMLAFVWAKENRSQHQIYIKQVGSESQARLTQLADDEYSPVWSPDSRRVAFLSSSDAGLALYVSSVEDHSVNKIYIPGETTRWQEGALAWSPDGKSFVIADHLGAQPSSSIYRIDAQTLRAQPLTSPPSGWEGDLSPVYSPDGTKIAFLRASENALTDLFWIAAGGGDPHQVTHDGKMIDGITWSSDSRSIVFSSNRSGEYGLYKIALDGGAPQRMPVGTEDAIQPSIPQNGNDLAFVRASAVFDILQISAAKGDHLRQPPVIVSSTAQDSAPCVSQSGSQFAFQSWRSGTQQIWVSSIDGQSLRQLTPESSVLSGSGSPSWSPSGDQIVFDSRVHGHSHIFLIAATGGVPKQVTFDDVNDIVPRWSVDGRTLYFRSNRGGRWQLWKLPATGGMPQPVTRDDGMVGQESPDGRWLYFTRGGESGIWRMPVAGGEEQRILDQPEAGYWAYWTVARSGIYFLDQKQATPAISVYDPATRKIGSFAKLSRLPPLNAGISLLHDGHSLLISDKYDAGSHISIAHGVF